MRLICEGTIEEDILRRAESKLKLEQDLNGTQRVTEMAIGSTVLAAYGAS